MAAAVCICLQSAFDSGLLNEPRLLELAAAAELRVRKVTTAVADLMVCKAVFNRPKDWIDMESMLGYGTVPDAAEVLRWVARIAGDEDPRYDRIVALLTHG